MYGGVDGFWCVVGCGGGDEKYDGGGYVMSGVRDGEYDVGIVEDVV